MMKYWNQITDIYLRQREKGIATYGQVLEENEDLTASDVIDYYDEELVDALMYHQLLKDRIKSLESQNSDLIAENAELKSDIDALRRVLEKILKGE